MGQPTANWEYPVLISNDGIGAQYIVLINVNRETKWISQNSTYGTIHWGPMTLFTGKLLPLFNFKWNSRNIKGVGYIS